MARRAAVSALVIALLGFGLAGCGNGDQVGFGNVQVFTITSPFPMGAPVPYTLTGDGFANAVGSQALVRFTATAGTPFNGGTSATADVAGNIISNGTIQGMSPMPPGSTVMAFVTVILPTTANGTSATPIATFIGTPAMANPDMYTGTGNVQLTVDAAMPTEWGSESRFVIS